MNEQDAFGVTPLKAAFAAGHRAVVELLLDRGATDALGLKLPVANAVLSGNQVLLESLLEAKHDANGLGVTSPKTEAEQRSRVWALGDFVSPLHLAARLGDAQAVGLLLKHDADPNRASPYGSTPLYMAITGGSEEVVRLLLDAGADAQFAIHMAAHKGQLALVELMADHDPETLDAPAPQTGETTLMVAAREGHINVIQYLLNRGCRTDRRDAFGNDVLFHAIWGGRRRRHQVARSQPTV